MEYKSIGISYKLTHLYFCYSFTIEVWIFLASGYPSTKLPIVCTNTSELCLYVEGGVFYTQVGSTIVNGTTTITANEWTLITTRYNAQRKLFGREQDAWKYTEI